MLQEKKKFWTLLLIWPLWRLVSGVSHWQLHSEKEKLRILLHKHPCWKRLPGQRRHVFTGEGIPWPRSIVTTRGHNCWGTAQHTNRVHRVILHQNSILSGYYSFLITIFWEPLCRIWKSSFSKQRDILDLKCASSVDKMTDTTPSAMAQQLGLVPPSVRTSKSSYISATAQLAWIASRTSESSYISATVLVFHSSLTYCLSGSIFLLFNTCHKKSNSIY